MGKLYIAYGSNLNLSQMAARCPLATIYAKGILYGWELAYRGAKTNSHATIIRKPESTVPVLIWEIQPEDEHQLDIYEEYPEYYFKEDIAVCINGKEKTAMAYIMNENRLPGRPSPNYINTIRQGYLDNDFDISIFEKSLEINSLECL